MFWLLLGYCCSCPPKPTQQRPAWPLASLWRALGTCLRQPENLDSRWWVFPSTFPAPAKTCKRPTPTRCQMLAVCLTWGYEKKTISFCYIISLNFLWDNFLFDVSVQVDLGFNMNILDIGGGFTGSEFQLRQASFQPVFVLGYFGFTFFSYKNDIAKKMSAACHYYYILLFDH